MYVECLKHWYNKKPPAKPNSKDYRDALKKILSDTSVIVDDMYESIKNELEDEILGAKEQREKISEETDEIYERLSIDLCAVVAKKKLPLRIRLLNKITCIGKMVSSNGWITIHCYFNNNSSNGFQILLSIGEIKELMGWK